MTGDPSIAGSSARSGALPTGLVTFLLTDVEGSTRLWDRHPRAMAQALARHDQLLAGIVVAHGGVLLKARGEGDSTFSVFGRPSGAAAAAMAAQAALAEEPWPEPVRIRVRMAVHMGEAAERDGDYYGPAVNRVARLRAVAQGGEVLVSASAAAVLLEHADGGWQLVDIGERELKDLARPERIYRLEAGAEPAIPEVLEPPGTESDAGEPPPVPTALSGVTDFVGREPELAKLRRGWEAAVGGARHGVLLAGEPGIGKTSLAAALAAEARAEGATVLYGRCDEGLGFPYQPFAQALRSLVSTLSDAALRRLATGDVPEVARILPEMGQRIPGLSPPHRSEADAERWLLFEGVAGLLSEASALRPILLVVEDLHWAPKPTLMLLRHLMTMERSASLMLVGTYRSTDLNRTHPLAEVLADLRRVPGIERLTLAGLHPDDVHRLVEGAAGDEPDDRRRQLAGALHAATAGNPFFVAEVLRHLAEAGAVRQNDDGRWVLELAIDELGLPESVREVVGRRLSRLSDVANRALSIAAVVGPAFDVRVVETLMADEPGDPLAALDEAVAAGLLTEDGGQYSFSHSLVRQTLLDEISSTRRIRMHRRVGEVLERLSRHDVEALAHHFAEAAVDGQAGKAADFALAAAERAIAAASYESAVALLERGLEALAVQDEPDLERRCDLRIALAAVHARFARGPVAREAVVGAVADARATGSAERLARAVVAHPPAPVGTPEPLYEQLLEEALHAVDETFPALRAMLLGKLAQYRFRTQGRRDEALVLSEEAVRAARQADDGEVLVAATFFHVAILSSSGRAAEGLRRLIAVVPNATQNPSALGYLATGHLTVGDRDRYDAYRAQHAALAERTRGWNARYSMLANRALTATLEGDWAAAAAFADDLLRHGPDDTDARNVWAATQYMLLHATGRLEELVPVLEAAVRDNHRITGFHAALALTLAELGQGARARGMLSDIVQPGLPGISRDQTWEVTLALVATLVAVLDEREAAGVLLEHLEPFSGLVLGPHSVFVCYGAADRWIAMLHSVLGRYDDAERHFEAAIALEERIGGRPLAARTRRWYGAMLRARNGPNDAERAGEVLTQALAEAEQLGMPALAAEVRGLLAGSGTSVHRRRPISRRPGGPA